MRLALAILVLVAAAGCGREEDAARRTATPEGPAPVLRVQKAKPIIVRTGLPAMQRGPLVIDPGGFNLGAVRPRSVHETMATIRNQGQAPVTITDTRSGCACTVPKALEGTVIPPGGSHPFNMTYTAGDGLGAKNAQVAVVFEHGGRRQGFKIQIDAVVSMVVRAEPPYVDALDGVTSGTVRVESTDGKPFRILSAYGQEPVFADGFDPEADEPRSAYTLQWNVAFTTISGCDNAKLWWVVETDHPEGAVLPLRIRHDCTGHRADPGYEQRGWLPRGGYLANVGAVRGGVPVEVDFELWKTGDIERISVTAVESLSPDATAELVGVVGGEGKFTTCTVRFTARRGFEGLLYAMVMFRTETGDKDIAFLARVLPD